jgi:hypothetical protein
MRIVMTAGRIASLREQLSHLRNRVEVCTISHECYRTHANEIAKALAERDLERFLAEHPEMA